MTLNVPRKEGVSSTVSVCVTLALTNGWSNKVEFAYICADNGTEQGLKVMAVVMVVTAGFFIFAVQMKPVHSLLFSHCPSNFTCEPVTRLVSELHVSGDCC